MKVVFFGTPDFALESFRSCIENAELLAVVSQTDKATGRGKKIQPTPVKKAALEKNIPVFQPRSLIKDSPELKELNSFLSENSVDLFVVTAYGKILPEKLLELPRLGSINVHASLLPNWRGAAPVQRSLEAGEKVTGVCLQKMVYELDAGDVIMKKKFNTPENMGAIELFSELSKLGGILLDEFFEEHKNSSKLEGSSQDKNLVSVAKKITREEGYWSPKWSASETHNKVRAFEAWPFVKAKLMVSKTEPLIDPFKLVETLISETSESLDAGSIEILNKKVILHGADAKCLELIKIQAPGKAATPAYNYFQNLKSKSGQERFSLIQIEG